MARILIVDDDPDIREISTMVLEMEGHQVAGAGGRAEGLAAFDDGGADLVLLDVMMEAEDDGVQMARALRGRGFAGPIVMLSGLSAAAAFGDETPLPVNDFLEKPIDPADLIAKVAALLDGEPQPAPPAETA